MTTPTVTRDQVLRFRVATQQLDRQRGDLDDTAVLDIGVQDTGPDGGRWALALRGVEVAAVPDEATVLAWTVRGAPHLYRRADLPSVAAAVQPYSDADAGKRIYDAARPLKQAGITNVAALDAVASAMRSVVTAPTVKGQVSSRVTAMMPAPYLRFCRPCDATHLYEMPFRLAALRAGLELQPGTSPPVLQPVPGFTPVPVAEQRHDLVRAYLHLLGPATPRLVAEYLDAPVADVRARWPEDVTEVTVEGQRRWLLSADAEALDGGGPDTAAPGGGSARPVRLLGPFDLFLQARDRSLLVPDAAHAKVLWPVLGRPGAVLVGGEVAGTWRPRQSGARLRVTVALWRTPSRPLREAVDEQAERLAGYRDVRLAGVELE